MKELRWMCAVLGLVLAPSASQAGFGLAIYKYDVPTLVRQALYCEWQGPEPAGGCDQCLARSVTAQFVQFCGPNHACLFPSRECEVCNGICSMGLVGGDDQTRLFWAHSPDIIEAAIGGCRQWTWQEYCPQGQVYGAYTKVLSLDVGATLPGSGFEEYGSLETDPAFWGVVYSLNPLSSPDVSERSWRQRIGVFSIIVDQQGGPEAADPYYVRALHIAFWVWLEMHRPGGYSPTQMGFPSDMPPPLVVEQAREIEWYTCRDLSYFGDCGLTPRDAMTWGTVKTLFR